MLKLLILFKIFLVFHLKFNILEAFFPGESTTTTLSLIHDYGYFAETHQTTTEDGYILTMYRLPYSPKNKSNAEETTRPVVYLMHGLFESSSDWVLSGYPRSLAFFLSDEGYDVWLGNARGTRFSKEHKYLNTTEPAYWDFSWHEIGLYDLPACVDYILKNTSTSKLQYIGYSQGTTSFLVAASSLPEFNNKIQSAYLLAPAAFLSHANSPSFALLALILGHPLPLTDGAFEFLPSSRLNQLASKILCIESFVVSKICKAFTFIGTGSVSKHANISALEVYYETQPAGLSIKQLIHYMQLFNSGKFRPFDYDKAENLKIYKQVNPPDYALEKISAPLYLYHGENDALADPQDVEILIKSLSSNALKKSYKMPYETWTHGDFLYANDIDELLYSILLDDLKKGAALQ